MSDADKVYVLREDRQPEPRKPDEDCIAECQKLLKMAEAGEITGIAWCARYYDDLTGFSYAGFIHTRAMAAAAAEMQMRLLGFVREEDLE